MNHTADQLTIDLFRQAVTLHQSGRLGEAGSVYRKILETNPDHAGTLHFMGMLRFIQRDFAEAVRYVERSLVLCDTDPLFHNNYGVILIELRRYEEAKLAFEKAVSLNPDYADAVSNLGLVSMLLKEPSHVAEKLFHTALRLQPGHFDSLRRLKDLYLKQDRFFESLEQMLKIAQRIPEGAEIHHQLGCLHGECGNMEKAKHHLRKAASFPGGQPFWKWKHLWYCPTFFENENQIDEYWKRVARRYAVFSSGVMCDASGTQVAKRS